MTYSQFAKPEEGKVRVWSDFTGIAITVDRTQPMFVAIVNETLKSLNSLQTGRALLAAIAQTVPVDNRGFKILIDRVSIPYKQAMDTTGRPELTNAGNYKFRTSGGRSFATPAQQALGVGSAAAEIPGDGVSAIVGWCQNQCSYTPRTGPNAGKMHLVPPAVTLGHELIHAFHSLKGVLKSGRSIEIYGKLTSEEEAATVGLDKYRDEPYTENKLRKDTRLPERLSYP